MALGQRPVSASPLAGPTLLAGPRFVHSACSATRASRVPRASSTVTETGDELLEKAIVEDTQSAWQKVQSLMAQVGKLSKPFWQGENKKQALLWTGGTLLLALMSTCYAVAVSFVQKFFWNALNAKDVVKFNKFLVLYMAILTLGPVFMVLFDWAKSRVALAWREALTKAYLGDYIRDQRFYKLQLTSNVDNTDQRIADDIAAFCDKAVAFFCTAFVSVCDLAVFSVILYKIFPPLYGTLLLYAAVGTSVTLIFGKPLIRLNRMQIQKEADFRFGLVRLREGAESVAFYNGAARERKYAGRQFLAAVQNRVALLNFERNLSFFTKWYRYLVQVIPALVIAPQYFAGAVPLGAISQTFFSFNHVLNDLSIIVNEFTGPDGLSSFSAKVERLGQMRDAIDEQERREAEEGGKIENTQDAPDGTIMVAGLSIFTPREARRRLLLKDLSFTLPAGERMLIVGLSGIGKSSLLRVVAGLWDTGSGSVSRPPLERTLFLSQRPYITLGSLRENVVYPASAGGHPATDAELRAALEKVNLGDVVDRLGGLDNADEQLGSVLSLGEQQRLAFARLLVARPQLAILDESTSALDLDNEERMYQLLDEVGCTVLSVGNRPSLVPFHSKVLRLTGNQEWRLEDPQDAAVGKAAGVESEESA